jgi:sugar fermentation stimulation protein A
MGFQDPFPFDCRPARFLRRVNRFLVEAELDGRPVAAHLHDPGRLTEILVPGADIFLRPAETAGRRTRFTVVLARAGDVLVSVDTALPNRFVGRCLRAGAIHEFRDYIVARREATFGRSRFDFHLMAAGVDMLLEVKSVTLVRDGRALFPDAPTRRGTRHVEELAAAARAGFVGTVLFLVQRPDATVLSPHRTVDPAFATALAHGFRQGLEILAYTCRVAPEGMALNRRIPVDLDWPGEAAR